jgi:hypothetical protein
MTDYHLHVECVRFNTDATIYVASMISHWRCRRIYFAPNLTSADIEGSVFSSSTTLTMHLRLVASVNKLGID